MTHHFEDDVIATDPILRYFDYAHLLPERRRALSRVFTGCAEAILDFCPRSPERTVALRKLLEAKDAAVRAALDA